MFYISGVKLKVIGFCVIDGLVGGGVIHVVFRRCSVTVVLSIRRVITYRLFPEIPAKEAGKRRISSRMNVEVAPQQAFFQAGERPGMAATCKKPWMNEGGPGTMGFPRVGGFQRVSVQTLWPWRAWEGREAASHIPKRQAKKPLKLQTIMDRPKLLLFPLGLGALYN